MVDNQEINQEETVVNILSSIKDILEDNVIQNGEYVASESIIASSEPVEDSIISAEIATEIENEPSKVVEEKSTIDVLNAISSEMANDEEKPVIVASEDIVEVEEVVAPKTDDETALKSVADEMNKEEEDIFDLSIAQIVNPDLSDVDDSTDINIPVIDNKSEEEFEIDAELDDVGSSELQNVLGQDDSIIEDVVEDVVETQVALEEPVVEDVVETQVESEAPVVAETEEVVEEQNNDVVAVEAEPLEPIVAASEVDQPLNSQEEIDVEKFDDKVDSYNPIEEAVDEDPLDIEKHFDKIEKEEVQTNNADTSVEIINNFAKMFSATPVDVKDLDVDVEAVVARSVEKKVLDINFDNIANAQIKKWLNDNLSLIVEKVVKEKLEEVLRKNGQ